MSSENEKSKREALLCFCVSAEEENMIKLMGYCVGQMSICIIEGWGREPSTSKMGNEFWESMLILFAIPTTISKSAFLGPGKKVYLMMAGKVSI